MTTVTINVDLGTANLPSNTPEVAKIAVGIFDGATEIAYGVADPVFPVTSVLIDVSYDAPGSYTWKAVSRDAFGNQIGSMYEGGAVDIPVQRLVPVGGSQG